MVMMYMLLLLALALASQTAAAADANGAAKRTVVMAGVSLTPKERAVQLVKKMPLEARLALVRGVKGGYVGNVPAQPNFGIPELHLEDGPQGVGDGTKNVTCWPNALSAVATFDRDVLRSWSAGMAEEQRGKGTNVMLGPMVNIARVPTDGRAFESFGEDPFLSSEMVQESVRGIQSRGVMACVKHWCDNNQEYNRTTISANVDTRTQHEIYFPAFAAGVRAGTGSVMCSYNRVNNTHTCQNGPLFQALKGEMEFEGFVMSDWGATHSTVESALAGLDMEMPDDKYYGKVCLSGVHAVFFFFWRGVLMFGLLFLSAIIIASPPLGLLFLSCSQSHPLVVFFPGTPGAGCRRCRWEGPCQSH
jgi:beta-glucosidase